MISEVKDNFIMQDKFGVIVCSDYLKENEKDIAIRAFAEFYHEITPKHQKRSLLIWNCRKMEERDVILKKMKIMDVPEKNIVFMVEQNKSRYMDMAKVCVHPSMNHFGAVIPEVLSYGVPVITLSNFTATDYINQSCGIILEAESDVKMITEFTYYLDMLYFDDEVLKVLERGAFDQYESKFGWGLKEFRKRNY